MPEPPCLDFGPVAVVRQGVRVGIGLTCLVLAGCSGAPKTAGPSVADKAICKVTAELVPIRSTPDYLLTGSGQLFGFVSTTDFSKANYVHTLVRSGDPAFERAGHALQRGLEPSEVITQVSARCSSLGLQAGSF